MLPAMIMEPLDRGVIVDFSDWEAVQAAYARLGKSLTDPVYIQYLATNIPDVQLNKLNGIAQPEFLSQINNQTVTPWLVEENGVVRFMTTPNQGISEYDNAMRILWPYDYTTSFIDYSYKGNTYLTESMAKNFMRSNKYGGTRNLMYMGVIGSNADGQAVQILLPPEMLWTASLKDELQEQLEVQGVNSVIGIKDPINDWMANLNGLDAFQTSSAPLDYETWEGIFKYVDQEKFFVLIH